MFNPLERVPRDQYVKAAMDTLLYEIDGPISDETLEPLALGALRLARVMESCLGAHDVPAHVLPIPPWQLPREPTKAKARSRAGRDQQATAA